MRMLIGDRWLDKDEKIDVLDPYDGALVDTVPDGGPEDVAAALRSAEAGFRTNRGLPVHRRVEILYRAAGIVRERQEEFARTIASEEQDHPGGPQEPAGASTPDHLRGGSAADRGETVPFDSRPGRRTGWIYYRFRRIIAAITPFKDRQPGGPQVGPAIAGHAVVSTATVRRCRAKAAAALIEAGCPGKSEVVRPGPRRSPTPGTDPRVRMIFFHRRHPGGSRNRQESGLKSRMELGPELAVHRSWTTAPWRSRDGLGLRRLLGGGPERIGVHDLRPERSMNESRRFRGRDAGASRSAPARGNDRPGPMITEEKPRVEDGQGGRVGASC